MNSSLLSLVQITWFLTEQNEWDEWDKNTYPGCGSWRRKERPGFRRCGRAVIHSPSGSSGRSWRALGRWSGRAVTPHGCAEAVGGGGSSCFFPSCSVLTRSTFFCLPLTADGRKWMECDKWEKGTEVVEKAVGLPRVD